MSNEESEHQHDKRHRWVLAPKAHRDTNGEKWEERERNTSFFHVLW